MFELIKLRCPHLMLADVGRDDRFSLVVSLIISMTYCGFNSSPNPRSEADILLPSHDLRQIHSSDRAGSPFRSHSSSTCLTSPTHGMSVLHVLADFRRIDVDMRDLRLRGEPVQPHRHPVIKAGADGDQQVAILQRFVRRISAVHARHAHPQLMPARKTAESEQRRRDRDPRLLPRIRAVRVSAGSKRRLRRP